MGILGVFSLIVGIIRLIPTAISLITEIIRLFHSINGGSYTDKVALAGEFKAALQDARKTKNTDALEAFHKKLGALCRDGVCGDLSALRQSEAPLG